MDSYERILVPVDFSAPSDEASARAISLARCLDSEVQFLHVIDDRQIALVPGSVAAIAVPAEPERARATHLQLTEYVRRLDTTGVVTSVRVRVGAPFEEVLAHIREWKPDLVVMGTHGRTGLSRAVLGSQAEMVVRRSKIPVLVVHAPSAQDDDAG